MRKARAWWSVPAALFMSLIVAGQALAAVSWGAPAPVGHVYAYNGGYALARTTSSSASYLNAVYTLDHFSTGPARDSGPREGVYHTRRSVSGTTWSTGGRLNPTAQHGQDAAIAASGTYAYVVWRSIASYERYDPAAKRELFLRYSSNYGSTWQATQVLAEESCGPSGCVQARVDVPSIAASGKTYYVAYVDGNTGNVDLAFRTVTADGGFGTNVGKTTARDVDGFYGLAAVAVSGRNVAVAWIADGNGKLVARVSRDGANTWSALVVLASSGAGAPHASAYGDRIGFTWDTASAIRLKLWKAGVWQATRTVSTFSSTGVYKNGYSPAIALAGTSTVGVAWADCRRAACDATASSTAGVDLSWRESTDNGATWKAKTLLAASSSSASRRVNDFPSVVMPSATSRYVLYNTSSYDFSTSRLYIRCGSGAA